MGLRLLSRLIKDGHQVSALSNSPASDAALQQFGVRVVRGGLEDIAAWSAALASHEAVIHAAAPVLVWGEWELFYTQITRATQQLQEASAKHGVKRFIFISSESVLQGGQPLLDIDETHAYPAEPNSYYGKAKMLAEQALLQTKHGPTCIILRPTFMWGERNRGLETILQKVRTKKFIWIDHGQASMEMVHVDNVVEAIRLSLTHGRPSGIYFVTDDNPMTVRQFLEEVFRAAGITPPKTSIPGWLARPLAACVESMWRLLHLRSVPPLSRFQLDLVALQRRYNIEKIKRDMGYRPVVSHEQGMQMLSSYYQKERSQQALTLAKSVKLKNNR